MKKALAILLTALLILTLVGCAPATPAVPAAPEVTQEPVVTAEPKIEATPEPEPTPEAPTESAIKVIVDTDMHYLSDDMLALFSLLQADAAGEIDLLGITTVGGNRFAAPATYDTLAILDQIGRGDVPVYMGTDEPLSGFYDLDELFSTTPPVFYTGAYIQMEQYTTDYLAVGELSTMQGYPTPTSRAEAQSAVDFMIEQVHAYPGQVTILALGPCINVARALQKDAELASLAAGIYYMGGWFSAEDGADSPSEFNWWYDPEAVSVCLQADWHSQTIISYAIGQQCQKGRDVYDRYQAHNTNALTQFLLDGLSPIYDAGGQEDYLDCCDPVVSGVFLNPALIKREEMRDVTIETARDDAFAVSRSWKAGTGPEGSALCRMILEVDRDAFWDYTAALYGA